MKYFLFFPLFLVVGCSSLQDFFSLSFGVDSPFSSAPSFEHFSSSDFSGGDIEARAPDKLITFRADGLSVARAFPLLSDLSGTSIVWHSSLDNQKLSGYFRGVPLSVVLDALARRCDSEVSQVGEVFYIGIKNPDDLSVALLPLPVGSSETLTESLKVFLSAAGQLSIVGSSLFIRDTSEVIRRIISQLDIYRRMSSRRYVAEVFFIRVHRRDLLDLSATLKVNAVDLLTSPNLETLFSLLLELEGSTAAVEVQNNPVLYLTEGLPASLHVGSERNFPSQSITETGAAVQTGWDTFEDGINLDLVCRRTSPEFYSLELSLEISEFSADVQPTKTTDNITSSVLVQHDKPVLIAALGRNSRTDGLKIFGRELQYQESNLLVWIKLRELSIMQHETG